MQKPESPYKQDFILLQPNLKFSISKFKLLVTFLQLTFQVLTLG